MSQNFRTHIKVAFSIFTLSLILMLLVNYGINLHSYKLVTGQIITHAHPYHSDPLENDNYPDHDHDSDEIYYYSSLYLLFFAFPSLFVFTQKQRCTFNFPLFEFSHSFQKHFSSDTRGPPSLYL